MSRVKERGRGLELRLRPRRVEIKPKEKRHDYIRRLDKAIETLEGIINSEETDEKTRIQAANSLARLISTLLRPTRYSHRIRHKNPRLHGSRARGPTPMALGPATITNSVGIGEGTTIPAAPPSGDPSSSETVAR